MSLVFITNTFAQIATENSKALDNTSLGLTVGASTPLDMNSVFPINANLGIRFAKEVTPIWGWQLEGIAVLNDNHFTDMKTAVKVTNIGLNSTLNMSNLLCGYKGKRRFFEVSTVTGLGWLHSYDVTFDDLTAKTGLDIAFNMGNNRQHSLVLTPAVYWNLTKEKCIQFNKKNAQLALNVSYIYHFKNSNGTHNFKIYDIGALNEQINSLQEELTAEKARKPRVIEKIVEKRILIPNQHVIQFAQNSAELSQEAINILNGINNDVTVNIVGTSSPEGKETYNQKLSEKRAEAVANFLNKKGVKVNTVVGRGVMLGETTNRLVIIDVLE